MGGEFLTHPVQRSFRVSLHFRLHHIPIILTQPAWYSILHPGRFDNGEVEQKIRAVHRLLLRHNYEVKMVEAGAGDDFGDDTLLFLHQINKDDGVMLAVCTAHYAEMTASKFSSYVELKYCVANGVKVLPLRNLGSQWTDFFGFYHRKGAISESKLVGQVKARQLRHGGHISSRPTVPCRGIHDCMRTEGH